MNPFYNPWVRLVIEGVVTYAEGEWSDQFVRHPGAPASSTAARPSDFDLLAIQGMRSGSARDLEKCFLKGDLTVSEKEGMTAIMQEVVKQALLANKPITPCAINLLKKLVLSGQYRTLTRTLLGALNQRKALRQSSRPSTRSPLSGKSKIQSTHHFSRGASSDIMVASSKQPAESHCATWTEQFEDNLTLAMKYTLFLEECDGTERKRAASLLATEEFIVQ